MNPSADMPPVLLTAPDFHGTLAAVRSLGRAGVPVTVADPDGMAPATWSRYASARVRCPDVRDTSRFLAWLLQFGQRSPRHVLLPTSDDTAWLYARHHAELTRYFYLQPADVQTVYSLLNKKRLNQKAGEAGLSVPRAWFPESRAELAQCAREARFPLLIKPATQIMFRPRGKGFRVEAPEALETLYQKAGACPYEPPLLEFDPDAARPMIQEFHAEAAEGIYNLSGLAHDGELVALRAGRKILQWPRRIGIGLCFAEAAVEPGLAAGLGRLLRPLRFGGVFEAEFIQVSGSFLLIDFNPRFYNQMAFDLARGLPVAMFASV